MKRVQTAWQQMGGNRLLFILVAVTIGASFFGLYVGLRQQPSPRAIPPTPAGGPSTPQVAKAVTYSEMNALKQGPNAGWNQATISELTGPQPEPPTYESQEQLRQLKRASLDKRDDLRAYNGAPPIVPHPVDQRSAQACLACHGEGLYLGDQRAPKMSHEPLANCTQCHAPAPPDIFDSPVHAVDNSFAGVPAPIEGERAWPGAPPVVPHSTHMRSDCLSCHGPTGLPGIRTSHPERRSCLQCHAPSADLNQRFAEIKEGPEFEAIKEETDEEFVSLLNKAESDER